MKAKQTFADVRAAARMQAAEPKSSGSKMQAAGGHATQAQVRGRLRSQD